MTLLAVSRWSWRVSTVAAVVAIVAAVGWKVTG